MIDRRPADMRSGRDDGAFDEAIGRLVQLEPKLPKDFQAKPDGSGIRLSIIDNDHDLERNGAVRYVFSWASGVDGTTKAGLDAGKARAEFVGSVAAPGKEDASSSTYLADPRYQKSGYFFCHAEDALGNQSTEYISSSVSVNDILDTTVPDDVQHLQITESGETANGTVYSMLSVSAVAPSYLGSFAGVQLFLKNYLRLGDDVQEGYFHHYDGPANGGIAFKVPYAPARRKGTVAITITAGSPTITAAGGLLAIVQPNDQIEVYGRRVTVQAVTNTTITLTANWAGLFGGTTSDYVVIGYVTVYAVSVSKGGTHRSDIENAPSRSMLFDGELSTPNAPTITGKNRGNAILITFSQVLGTSIKGYRIFRAVGSVSSIASMEPVGWIEQPKASFSAGLDPLVFTDTNFTIEERERGQFFSYGVITYNERDDPSADSNIVTVSCRLDASQDTDPSVPSRDGSRNLLFDGFIGGTGVTVSGVANVVDDSDATQDNGNFNPAIAPSTFTASSGTRLNAWTRWKYGQTNQTTIFPIHVNGNEIKFPPPGSGSPTKDVRISQFIKAWATATATDRKFQVGQYVTLQVKAYCDAGVTPDGSFFMGVAQYTSAGASQWALLRTRVSSPSDQIQETSNLFLTAASHLAGTDASAPMRLYATFRLDGRYSTEKIAVTFGWQGGTTSNIYIKEAMLNDGVELAPWTADMGNIDQYYPASTNPTPPGTVFDPPGDRTGEMRYI